jgi:methionyl aminopeptidase
MRSGPFTGPLRPHYPLSPKREVPAHIKRPDYADHRELTYTLHYSRVMKGNELTVIAQGQSPIEMARERAVKTLNAEEIAGMRKVCRVSHLPNMQLAARIKLTNVSYLEKCWI